MSNDLTILVRSWRDAATLLKAQPNDAFTHIVSINGVHDDSPPPPGYATSHARKLRLNFDDIVCMHGLTARMLGYVPASRDDLVLLIDFYRELLAEDLPATVLIHCAQGISRSAAAAFVLAHMHWREPALVAKKMLAARATVLIPNHLVLELAEEVLGVSGALLHAFELYKKLQQETRIAACSNR